MRVAIAQAKGQLSEIVRRAEAGRRVVLTRRGRPVAQVVAYSERRLVGLFATAPFRVAASWEGEP